MKRLVSLLLLLPVVGCVPKASHLTICYTVGAPYQVDGTWQYPKADFVYDETGIAAISHAPPDGITADGERYSADAFAAAHPTLELPAIARVTNLENGRQIVVRINDRGPSDPARILAVTPRVASLLGFSADGTAPVRVQVLAAPSEALALSLPGGPALEIERAPVGAVAVSTLPLPGSPLPAKALAGPALQRPAVKALPPGPAPGALSQVAPEPGVLMRGLYVRTGIFTDPAYAALQATSLARFGAVTIPRAAAGALKVEVRFGPFASLPEADAVLREVFRAGFEGARLVVE
ncbi:MAG: RlpA-like double-psi beta-barrel domain-containing protein [Acetobacteraceae bacterium]